MHHVGSSWKDISRCTANKKLNLKFIYNFLLDDESITDRPCTSVAKETLT